MLTQAHMFQNLNIGKATGEVMVQGNKGDLAGKDLGRQFKSLMTSLMGQVDTDTKLDMKALMSMMNLDEAQGDKSSSLLALLSGKISDNGTIPLQRMIGEDGLTALESLLNNLGFNSKNVKGFIASLKEGSQDGEVSLSSLMSKLGRFAQEDDAADELDLSALPYIESLLNSFKLPPHQVASMMSRAGQSGSGMDLDALVADLKKLQALQGGTLQGAATDPNNLIKGLGLETSPAGTLSLDEFVTKLEALIQGKNPGRASIGTLESVAQTFADSVRNSTRSKMSEGQPQPSDKGGDKSEPFSLNFESPKVKSPQPLSRDASESAFFSGAKTETLKSVAKEGLSDSAPSFEKNMKEGMGLNKEQADTANLAAKALSGTEIYEKVAEMKSSGSAGKTLPSYVTDQVARQISKAVKLGDSEITFSIRPPEMGRVQLSIENTRDGIKISILAEQHATRDMLLSNSSDLRSLLADQGIRLDKLDVDVSGSFGQNMAQARQDAENSSKERKNRDANALNLKNEKGNEIKDVQPRSWRQTRGNLDLVA